MKSLKLKNLETEGITLQNRGQMLEEIRNLINLEIFHVNHLQTILLKQEAMLRMFLKNKMAMQRILLKRPRKRL